MSPPQPLTVEQYHSLGLAGVIDEDDRLELLEGWLIERPRISPPRRFVSLNAREVLKALLPPGWWIDQRNPIATTDSEPEPDLTVIRGDFRDYPDRHPGPGEVGLVMEAADDLVPLAHSVKKRIYARVGLPIYWIINLIANRVEVYTDPTGPADAPDYRSKVEYGPDAAVPFVFDGREVGRIPTRDLLP